jgi:RNA polymerase sigma factor (sigma-70 family)
MTTNRQPVILRVVRRLAVAAGDEPASDRELLHRFVTQRDEMAFTALMQRHGALVLGVGLRVLRHRQDAEDVCQATFLLLAKKAGTLGWQDSIANWLHGVAYHLALRCRRANQRRSAREGRANPRTSAGADPWADLTLRDLQDILDAELNRLGARYRAPLILCCLQGKTRDEAARHLGLRLSTLSGRLEAGRALLRQRLARRGIPPALGLAGITLLAPSLAAGVPAALVHATGHAVQRMLVGEALGRLVSIKVLSLVHGGMQAMFFAKLKLIAAGAALMLVAWFAAWSLLPSVVGQEAPLRPPGPATGKEPAPALKPKQGAGAGTLLLARQGGLIALTPDGKEGAALSAPEGTRGTLDCQLSPDGTVVVHTVTADQGPRPPRREGEAPEPWPFKIVVRKLGAAEPSAAIDMPAQELRLTWTADGNRIVVTKVTGAQPDDAVETLLLDPATRKTQALELPLGVQVLDSARDGKSFLVLRRKDKKYELGVAVVGAKDMRVLTKLHGWTGGHRGRFAPDGARILYTDADPADKDANKWGVSSKPYVLDVASKQTTAVADFPQNGRVEGIAWSPDGKRIAYSWVQLHADLLKKDTLTPADVNTPTEGFLMIADADGRNARTVSSARGANAINRILGAVDWR